ncbi:MAG: choice-of-anchor V domain-containing protein, partial [Candidatus Poseidoniales archaeon]
MRKFAMSIFLATFLVMVLFTPLNDASSNGKPNSAVGCGSCHGSANSGVTPTHNFPSMYTPGQTYTVTIGANGGVSGTSGGFSLEVTQGTLSNPGGFAQISQGSATHSGSNVRSWTVDWTAPPAGSGQVTIRLAVNTVNNNGMNSGDAWNTLTTNIQEDVPANQPPSASNVQIQPNGNVGYNQDLQLTYTYQDPDSDPESNSEIKWFVDGNHVPSMNGKTTILASDTTIGEVWSASVTPRDSVGNLGMEEQSTTTATIIDLDSDADGVLDSDDAFPNDPNEQYDADNDGVGDNADAFPNDPSEQADSDNDNVGDNADAFPNDPNEQYDADNDGVGDNADAFPNDPSEQVDSDNDTVGDNADTDDDNDGLLDTEEATLGTDPFDED